MSEQKPICGNCRHWSTKGLRENGQMRECKRKISTIQAFMPRRGTCVEWRAKKQ